MSLPAFKDYLAMTPAQQAPHKDGFAKLNLVPPVDFQAMWHRDGWTACKECDGNGFYEYDTGNPHTYEEHHECEECEGSGQRKLSFEDFMDSLGEEA